MNFNISEALKALTAAMMFLVANGARPAANYLFATLLPEILKYDYQAKSGSMTVRSLMAGLVGMDSPYPETGLAEISTFNEETAKMASRSRLPEAALRHLQQMLMQLQLSGAPTNEVIINEALNFLDKVIVQGHLDAMEYLRGQAICTGVIDWTFNGIRLNVDYGIPSANKLTPRTGNDGYGGSASKFWTDVRGIRRVLKGNVRAILVHPDTLDVIRYNPVNSLVAISEGASGITFRKANAQGALSQDTADTITLVSYGEEGEIFNPSTGLTSKIPFMQRGKMVGVANNSGTGYVVGAGSTPPPENALGYTHLAPTTESFGRPGRWAEVYVPQDAPHTIEGRGVTNGLPVIEAPDKIAIGTTEMA